VNYVVSYGAATAFVVCCRNCSHYCHAHVVVFYWCLVQLMRHEKITVRQWTKKLSAGSVLHVEFDGLRQHNRTRSRHSNITQLMNTYHSMMPVKREMPVAEAELNFHEYVIADVSMCDCISQ